MPATEMVTSPTTTTPLFSTRSRASQSDTCSCSSCRYSDTGSCLLVRERAGNCTPRALLRPLPARSIPVQPIPHVFQVRDATGLPPAVNHGLMGTGKGAPVDVTEAVFP